jgi:TRAF3-interacting protein 1
MLPQYCAVQKIMNVVGIVLGQPVPAKALKIVAGLEPENTNVFLQMLGRACKMSSGAAAVQVRQMHCSSHVWRLS